MKRGECNGWDSGENAEDLGSGDAGRRDGDGGEHGRDHHARQQQARPGLD